MNRCCTFLLSLLLFLSGCDGCNGPSPVPVPPTFPRFETLPEKLLTDDTNFMTLQEDFVFYDGQQTRWFAPKGTKSDGASIPQLFLSFTGDRFDPELRAAAVVHDAYCQDINKDGPSYHSRPWRDVHRMFYDACICRGASKTKAQLMYAAVWLGGPRWDVVIGSETALPQSPSFAPQSSSLDVEPALPVANQALTMSPRTI
jgi:hypothetical protein